MAIEWINGYFLGVRIWIWLYLLFSIVMFIIILVKFFKERIRKKFYELRYPEKLLKVVIHYKSNMFKEYWRIIPNSKEFRIEEKLYHYTDKAVLRDNEIFGTKKGLDIKVSIDGKEYNILDNYKQVKRWRAYPEVHFFFNCPSPIDFDLSGKEIDFTSQHLEEFKENDLFTKLLTMDTQKSIMVFLLVVGIINLLATVIVLSKIMGWLK
jgi:hypothetical protein